MGCSWIQPSGKGLSFFVAALRRKRSRPVWRAVTSAGFPFDRVRPTSVLLAADPA